MSRKLRKNEREWAIERSAAHCWLCGKSVVQMRLLSDYRTWNCNPRDGFYAMLLNKQEGATRENIVCMCGSCASQYHRYGNINHFRFMKMRKQYQPILSEKEVSIIAHNGGKASFVYHYFWFEKPEGRAVIQSVLDRLADSASGATNARKQP